MSQQPLMLGIAGDSGAGKNTLVRGLVRMLGTSGVTPLSLDGYHRYDRAERIERGLTSLDPANNDIETMIEHLQTLRRGGQITKPVYDHRAGIHREPERVVATDLVVASGLLTLASDELAACFDLSVYLEPDETLRLQWKRRRDLSERGYSAEQIEHEQMLRRQDAERFIHPQRRRADLIVTFYFPNAAETDVAKLAVRIKQRRIHLLPDIDETLRGIGFEQPADVPEIRMGNEKDADGGTIEWVEVLPAATNWLRHPLMDELGLVSRSDPLLRSNALAVAQLFIAHQLLHSQR
jgi:phosphoribulokinase